MNTTPVFLVAARRSGTTLMRLMLKSHPDLHWERGWEFATTIVGEHGEPPKPEQLQDLRSRLGISTDPDKAACGSMSDYRDLLDQYINALCFDASKPRFGATTHIAIDRLPYIYPDSKYIHLIRDPRDVAISAVNLGWDATYWSASRHWIQAELEWDRIKSRVDPDHRLDVHYEKLACDPEVELRRICDFIGIPYTEQLFDYTKTSSYGYPDPSLVERWRGKISLRNIRLVEARTGPLLELRGYRPETDQQPPGFIDALSLRAKNAVVTRTRRIRTEGLMTVVLSVLVHRFGFNLLKKRLQHRQDELRKQNIVKLESKYSNKTKL